VEVTATKTEPARDWLRISSALKPTHRDEEQVEQITSERDLGLAQRVDQLTGTRSIAPVTVRHYSGRLLSIPSPRQEQSTMFHLRY